MYIALFIFTTLLIIYSAYELYRCIKAIIGFYWLRRYISFSKRLSNYVQDNVGNLNSDERLILLKFINSKIDNQLPKTKKEFLDIKKEAEDKLPFIVYLSKEKRKRQLKELGL